MKTAVLETPLGRIRIRGNENSITEVTFVSEEIEVTEDAQLPSEIVKAKTQLQAYFHNSLKNFDLNLKPSGTDFQKKAWSQLQQVPFGSTENYLAIAKKLGDIKVIRAAASANGKNPIAIIIPCHRIIGSDGSLTGYAGGLWRKKWLLEHESGLRQTSLF
ncbi:MAG: methylated-DNA--[protein]-cysteine S-methyltransferase [Leeuwenhoekiella sp.]